MHWKANPNLMLRQRPVVHRMTANHCHHHHHDHRQSRSALFVTVCVIIIATTIALATAAQSHAQPESPSNAQPNTQAQSIFEKDDADNRYNQKPGWFVPNESATRFHPAASDDDWRSMLASVRLPTTLELAGTVFPVPAWYDDLSPQKQGRPADPSEEVDDEQVANASASNQATDSIHPSKSTLQSASDQATRRASSVVETTKELPRARFHRFRKLRFAPDSTIVKLLGPHAEAIYNERREKTAFFVRHTNPECELCEISQPSDVLHMISTHSLVYNKDLRFVIKSKNQFYADTYATAAEALAAFLSGSTIVVNALHYLDSRLHGFCEQLEESLSTFASVNMYLSPASAQGFKAHHDLMDSVILQTAGSKVWRVCNPDFQLPSDVNSGNFLLSELRYMNCTDILLTPGDVLYLPRGTIHSPYTIGNMSMHLTFGLSAAFPWQAVMDDFIKSFAHIPTALISPKVSITLPELPSREEIARHVRRPEIVVGKDSLFPAELDEEYQRMRDNPAPPVMEISMERLLVAAWQQLIQEPQETLSRSAMPSWLLHHEPNMWPSAANRIAMLEHWMYILEMLVTRVETHFLHIKYVFFYQAPRNVGFAHAGRYAKPRASQAQIFETMAYGVWDCSAQQIMANRTLTDDERAERDRLTQALRAFVRNYPPALFYDAFDSALDGMREKISAGLLEQREDVVSNALIKRISTGTVLKRTHLLAGMVPVHPLAPVTSDGEFVRTVAKEVSVTCNRQISTIPNTRVGAYVWALYIGRSFSVDELAHAMIVTWNLRDFAVKHKAADPTPHPERWYSEQVLALVEAAPKSPLTREQRSAAIQLARNMVAQQVLGIEALNSPPVSKQQVAEPSDFDQELVQFINTY
ncbi:hypothetical protein CAOG_06525 [Capsaspora owczarzaki ATCC 30864]|uniref:Bifunctional lysine-specific demethylase and histidyl-hydroxylase n=1 Tax=Capsaspora owczarzaki (strain ATCC 30864) TaxID=595528 RepID=A0A0D2VX39_CAPO3|nr:hypothetical protein CAOG_06525 [Capsaspora owczarzaki ATCC 30864]KJE96162.1 hypothetical protein CAOG_006525 [Capsaspora owczarzaki ATCC 30864]|eukprot:XP_004345274.1 hypothetical protein CAOG_06525 [Capsaspora owczarzaki ATCC 30864]